MSTITTYTRKHFDPVHPAPELLCVEDFAHALPMICRGNGHVTTFWSVGEHCICCAKEAAARGYSRRLVLACLLHDASECYMSDVPRPLKQEMPRYREIEDHLLSVIYEKYLGSDLTAEEQRMMKQIDNDLLWYDLTNLLEEPQAGINGCLKDRHMAAARIPRWIAEAVFLVAAVNIFSEIAGNAPHTGKLRFAGFILSHKHTDRLAMIPCLIEQPFPETPANHIRADPAPL